MRYAWDLKAQYLREAGLDHGVKGSLASAMLERMRRWDLANTPGVDAFATLSRYIAERIERAYGRSAVVIYPPVDTEYFTPATATIPATPATRATPAVRGEEVNPHEVKREEFYVTASRFVPYKRVDMIASAFRSLADRKLVGIGDGPDAAKGRAGGGRG